MTIHFGVCLTHTMLLSSVGNVNPRTLQWAEVWGPESVAVTWAMAGSFSVNSSQSLGK